MVDLGKDPPGKGARRGKGLRQGTERGDRRSQGAATQGKRDDEAGFGKCQSKQSSAAGENGVVAGNDERKSRDAEEREFNIEGRDAQADVGIGNG